MQGVRKQGVSQQNGDVGAKLGANRGLSTPFFSPIEDIVMHQGGDVDYLHYCRHPNQLLQSLRIVAVSGEKHQGGPDPFPAVLQALIDQKADGVFEFLDLPFQEFAEFRHGRGQLILQIIQRLLLSRVIGNGKHHRAIPCGGPSINSRSEKPWLRMRSKFVFALGWKLKNNLKHA